MIGIHHSMDSGSPPGSPVSTVGNLEFEPSSQTLYCAVCLSVVKEYTGCSQCLMSTSPLSCRMGVPMSRDSWKVETEDTSIGNSWSPSPRKLLYQGSGTRLDPIMLNSPEVKRRGSMSGKKPPLYPVN